MRQEDNNVRLATGRALVKNVFLNLIGQAAPMIVAVIAIPSLVKGLGVDRFGVLTLSWIVVGYFSLFDLGLGRALTRLVAERLGTEKYEEIPALIWTSLSLMGLLGVLGASVVASLTPWLVNEVLKIPIHMKDETTKVFYLLAISIVIVITTAGLRGVLEACQRFDLTNTVRIPMGVFTFLGPVAVLPFSNSLISVVAVLVAGRCVALVVYLLLCFHVLPMLRQKVQIKKNMMRPLLMFGGWMTVSNIISPVLVYLDRFLIGALVSVTAVAYYATPYEIVTKLGLISGALVGVLFPAFSASLAQDRNHTALLFSRGVKFVYLILFPIVLVIIFFAREALSFWLNVEFSDNSTFVLQWLAVGVLINSLAQIPFALIQGAGRPDLTAKLHLIELPLYLIILWLLVSVYGVKGAAVAWVVRVSVDAILLFRVAELFSSGSARIPRQLFLIMGATFLPALVVVFVESVFIKVLFLSLMLLIFFLFSWRLILSPDEKILIQNRFKMINSFAK